MEMFQVGVALLGVLHRGSDVVVSCILCCCWCHSQNNCFPVNGLSSLKRTPPSSTGRGEQQHSEEGRRNRETAAPPRRRREHKHPKEEEADNTTQKKEKGEEMQHPRQRKKVKGNNHFAFTYLTFIVIWFNLSCIISVS